MAKTALSNTSSMMNTTPTHDEIAAQAYQIYLREGCPEGRDLDHWLQAEIELRANANANGSSNGKRSHAATPERSERGATPNRATKQDTSAVLPNSVVPAAAPIAQVSNRTNAPRKSSGKREAAGVAR